MSIILNSGLAFTFLTDVLKLDKLNIYMSEFVINPLTKEELMAFVDGKAKKILKYYIIKSLFSQPEPKVGQGQLPIQIPKEHIEQWFTQALDVAPIGAGSYPIDIYNERENWGADIKMLNIKVDSEGNVTSSSSGEASLGQNFSGAGLDLDSLFASKNYELIKDNWITLLKTKFEGVKVKYPSVKKMYYFFILRPGVQTKHTNFYFAGASINLKKLDSVTVNKVKSIKQSVFLDNYISNEFGNVKIYKAKKRMELRLNPKKWVNEDRVIKIETSFSPRNINLRSKSVNTKFLTDEINKILEIEVNFDENVKKLKE